jgi:hypothetical protein
VTTADSDAEGGGAGLVAEVLYYMTILGCSLLSLRMDAESRSRVHGRDAKRGIRDLHLVER